MRLTDEECRALRKYADDLDADYDRGGSERETDFLWGTRDGLRQALRILKIKDEVMGTDSPLNQIARVAE